MDNRNDQFDILAELIFWVCLTTILVLIIGTAIWTYPALDLSKTFWPIAALGSIMVGTVVLALLKKDRHIVQSGNIVHGDLVGGDLIKQAPRNVGQGHVNTDLAEMNATLNVNRERYGTRASDVPTQPTHP